MQKAAHHLHRAGKWKNSVPIDIAKPSGKPILLFFWRSHTPESVEVLHALDEFIGRQSSKFPMTVIAVHAPEFDQEANAWEGLVESLGIKLPVFHDPNYHTWELFGIQHAPSFVLLDSDGKQVFNRVGDLETSGVLEHLMSLV